MDFRAILHDANNSCWLSFDQPTEVLCANTLEEVKEILEYVENTCKTQQKWSAGFISYHAAAAFDKALPTQSSSFPLMMFAIFDRPKCSDSLETFIKKSSANIKNSWASEISRLQYDNAIDKIKDFIAAGETYQVNYTYRLRQPFDPAAGESLFAAMNASQQCKYGAFIQTAEHIICSASPELFFSKNGRTIKCRPMKGTAHRGLTFAQDEAAGKTLQGCEKNRAENVMIVDMMRNDLGRIADAGSVNVDELFAVERYPTLWQMTSEISAQSDAGLYEVMAGLFPCASITGAPKRRTMEIIEQLESSPRNLYTGSIGFISPDGRMQFNVAIRTAVVDVANEQAEYGVGGGVVWDSCCDSEFEESLLKAKVLTASGDRDFKLLETMLFEHSEFFLLNLHIDRLSKSAEYFCYSLDEKKLRAALANTADTLDSDKAYRVRLTLSQAGEIAIEAFDFDPTMAAKPARVTLARQPIDKNIAFLYHKTTARDVYDSARADAGEFDDVILYNADGLVCESTIANIVVEFDGKLLTPKIQAGLLGGTFRQHLIDTGEIKEADITVEMLKNANKIWLINSLRKWREAKLDIR